MNRVEKRVSQHPALEESASVLGATSGHTTRTSSVNDD